MSRYWVTPPRTAVAVSDITRVELADAIRRSRGNLNRAAWMLGTDSVSLSTLVGRANLGHLVRAERRRAARPDWVVAARRRLIPMDEQVQAVVEACRGKSEDEIRELIESSTVAESVPDARLLAAYVAHLAAA